MDAVASAKAKTNANANAFVARRDEGRILNQLGHTAREIVTAGQSGGAYYVFEVLSPPGLGIPPHVHSREDEVVHILAGSYDVLLGERTVRAGPGDTLHFARGTLHGFSNAGDEAGRTLWFVSPGESFQRFFRDLAEVPPGPPDVAALVALFARYGMTLQPPPG